MPPTTQQLNVPQVGGGYWSGAGASPNPITPIQPSSTASPISTDMIGTQPLNITAPPATQPPPISALPGAGTPAATTPTTPTAPAAGQTNTFTDKLSGLVAKFTGKAQDQQIAEQTAASPINAQITSLGSQLQTLQAHTIAGQDNITRFGGTNGAYQSGELARLNRDSSIQGLLIQSRIDSLKGDLATAKTNADLAIETKYAGIQQDINTARDNIYNNWDSFSASEKKRASAALSQLDSNDTYAKQNIEDEKAVQALAAAALSLNPGDQKVMLAVDEATKSGDLMTATKLLAPYQKDPIAVLLQAGQLQAQRDAHNLAVANVAKINNDIKQSQPPVVATDANAPYINAFNNASAGLGVQKSQQANQVFASYMAKGDLAGARDYIVRTAMSNAPADQQNQAIGRTQAIAAMNDVQDLLAQAKAKGIDTNLLSGKLVDVGTKLGASPNTDLSYIGSRILQSLITYRKGMTGVAFGPQEAKDYEKIFPSYTNIDSLNTARIAALKDSLNANNAATLGFYVGADNYNALFGQSTTNQLPSNSTSSNFSTTPPNYSADLTAAKAAIAAGADPAQVKARMLTKYKQVDL